MSSFPKPLFFSFLLHKHRVLFLQKHIVKLVSQLKISKFSSIRFLSKKPVISADKLRDAWSSFWLKRSCQSMREFRNTKVLAEPLWRAAIQFHKHEWEEFGFSGSWEQQRWSYEGELEQRRRAGTVSVSAHREKPKLRAARG